MVSLQTMMPTFRQQHITLLFVQVILFNYKTIFNCHFLIVEGIVLKLLSVKKYFVYHVGMKFNEK